MMYSKVIRIVSFPMPLRALVGGGLGVERKGNQHHQERQALIVISLEDPLWLWSL